MRPIDEKYLLADIEGLKKSPWFNADYISDERRLGMKEALDMMSSIIRNSPTVDAIPVKWLEERYPIHGTYGTEAYFRKAYAIYEVIKEWERGKKNDRTITPISGCQESMAGTRGSGLSGDDMQ